MAASLNKIVFHVATVLICVAALSSSSRLLSGRSFDDQDQDEEQTLECSDELSTFACQEVVDQEKCLSDNAMARSCRKSCGLCSADTDEDSRAMSSRGPQCEDMVPTCSEFGGAANQQFCCMFISFMNQTCPKSCMFCTETSIIPPNPIQGLPSFPGTGGSGSGSGGSGPQAPTVVTQQNPCKVDSSKPPTVGVNPNPGR